jgi:hypothetical protein
LLLGRKKLRRKWADIVRWHIPILAAGWTKFTESNKAIW